MYGTHVWHTCMVHMYDTHDEVRKAPPHIYSTQLHTLYRIVCTGVCCCACIQAPIHTTQLHTTHYTVHIHRIPLKIRTPPPPFVPRPSSSPTPGVRYSVPPGKERGHRPKHSTGEGERGGGGEATPIPSVCACGGVRVCACGVVVGCVCVRVVVGCVCVRVVVVCARVRVVVVCACVRVVVGCVWVHVVVGCAF